MHWQILRWPFRTTALIVVGIYVVVGTVFSNWAELDFWVAVMVLSLGLPVWYSVLGALSLYARKLLVQAATGMADEPIESESDVNPFGNRLALNFAVAHLLMFALLYHAGPGLGPLHLLVALLFPFLWLGVVLEDSLLDGLDPRRVVRVLKGLSLTYVIAVPLASGGVGYLHYALQYANHPLNVVASAFCFLLANTLLGELLYARRRPLELVTAKSPEQQQAAEAQARAREFDDLFHELHRHTSVGNHSAAIERLEAFRAATDEDVDALLHERLRGQRDKRLCLEHAVGYLERLTGREEARKAWVLLKECLTMDERFRPSSDHTLLVMTRAAGPEDAGLVNELLRDFDTAYPDSPLIPDALFRRARICIERLNRGSDGMALLDRLSERFPEFAAGEPYKRYRSRLLIR